MADFRAQPTAGGLSNRGDLHFGKLGAQLRHMVDQFHYVVRGARPVLTGLQPRFQLQSVFAVISAGCARINS